MKNSIKLIFATISVTLLTACGGGGASGTAELITPPTLNLRSAWESYFQQNTSSSFSISGTVNGFNVGGSGAQVVAFASPVSILAIDASSPFPGPSVNLSNVSRTSITTNGTLVLNGTQNVVTASTQEYYVDSSGVLRMIKDVDDNEQTIITSFVNFPNQATAGTSGVLYSGTVFSRLGYTCGTETATYSVAGETNTSLILTVTYSQNTTNRALGECTTQTSTSQTKYRLSSSGLRPVESVGSTSTASGSLKFTF